MRQASLRAAPRPPARRGPARVIRLVPPARGARVDLEGVRAGLVATASILAWWIVADAARGRPLETPGAIAAAVFHHGSRPLAAAVGVDVVGIAWAHVLVFMGAGILASPLLALAERTPHLGFGVLLLLILGVATYLVGVAVVGQSLLPARVLPTFVSGNVLGTVAVALVLHRRRPVRIRP